MENSAKIPDRAPVCHLWDPGSNLGQAKFLQWWMALSSPTQDYYLCTSVKTGWGDSYLDKGVEFDLVQVF
jgi:hypothetical protein